MERFLIRKFNTSAENNKRQNTSTFASGSSNGVKSSSASGSGSGFGPKWLTKDDSLLVRIDQSCPNKLSSKIACFDLDETLQKTKSGKKPYMTHENDFTFRDASVKEALNALHESGFKIVIFSNQGMVKSAVDGKKAEQIRKRLEIFAKELDAKFDFYAATQSGEKDVKGYRKPNIGMWQEMLSRREIVLKSTIEKEEKEEKKETKTTTTTDITITFYVGDAANRPQDHSDADIAFAKNCEVEFFVPEQFFEGGSFRKFLRNDDDGNEREKETKTARETED